MKPSEDISQKETWTVSGIEKMMLKVISSELTLSSVSHDVHIQKRVYLKKDNIQGILQWATAILEQGTSVTEHQHDDATEIFHILEGSMKATINETVHQLTQGDLLVIEAGDVHAFENPNNHSCKFLYTLLQN